MGVTLRSLPEMPIEANSSARVARRALLAVVVAAAAVTLAAPAGAVTRHRHARTAHRGHRVEDTEARCVYCGAIAVTAVVVNGGAIPVCARHAANPEGDAGTDSEAPEPELLSLPPLPELPPPDPSARSRSGPPILPPADGLLLPEAIPAPANGPDAPHIHRAIRRRSRGQSPLLRR